MLNVVQGYQRRHFSSLLLCLAWLVFSLVGAKAQTTERDTLFYFDPDSLIESCFCPPMVLKQKNYNSCYAEDYAIYYEVNDSIKYYYLKELHIQFVSDFENCYSHGPLPEGFEIYIRIGRLDSLPEQGLQLDSLPGEIVATIPITINDSTELYPNWKIINLDTFPNLRNLSGNFWIQGRPMSSSTWDTAFSRAGHTFAKEYFEYEWKWTTGPVTPNWAVKAVIEYSNLSIDDDSHDIPEMYQLYQNYPNPFNTSTNIHFTLIAPSNITMSIYNILGQEVRTLLNEQRSAGVYTIAWDGTSNAGRPLPSGIYFVELQTRSSDRAVRKMIMLQ